MLDPDALPIWPFPLDAKLADVARAVFSGNREPKLVGHVIENRGDVSRFMPTRGSVDDPGRLYLGEHGLFTVDGEAADGTLTLLAWHRELPCSPIATPASAPPPFPDA